MVYRLFYCIVGPRLYAIYPGAEAVSSSSRGPGAGRLYEPNAVETHMNRWLSAASYLGRASVAWYGVMFWAPWAYRNGFLASLLTLPGLMWAGKAASFVFAVVFGTLCVRGLARYFNRDYAQFIERVFCSPTSESPLNLYDFDLRYAPVDFTYNGSSGDYQSKMLSFMLPNYDLFWDELKQSVGIMDFVANLFTYPVCHTFGKHLLFPGTYNWLFHMMWSEFTKQRMKELVENRGKRLKLQVGINGNDIDCMVIDRRKQPRESHPHGNKIVICCEGNAGFYELGLPSIPRKAGYSVLGWNYPGFASSTGLPYPRHIEESMTAIMAFVTEELKFDLRDVIFYSWSIGGYIAAWGAANYPDCDSVILDATFDDLYPLAVDRMPSWFRGIVKRATNSYLKLPIADKLLTYDGPIRMIRRTKDDIICTDPPNIASNRANNLLMKLLSVRYPKLISSCGGLRMLEQWLALKGGNKDRFYSELVDESLCAGLISDHLTQNGCDFAFPSTLGEDMAKAEAEQLLIYLGNKYLVDFSASHDLPLPESMFVPPWSERSHLTEHQHHTEKE